MIKYPNGGIPRQPVSGPVGDDGKELFIKYPGGALKVDKWDWSLHQVLAHIVIHGEPVPAGRPRFSNGHAYDPRRSRDYKRFVSQEAKMKYHGGLLRDMPLKVEIRVYRHVQRSLS